ncbi:MAG TPA: RHS repeat-associated core domain-containing protein, partial [Syntrophales bacterium]|nr:RHS repeat-associated core domain-containing protein [Syntrophales bacterium]
LDTETGLYNFNARLYDPAVGRFISPDPALPDLSNSKNPWNYDPQMLNRYAYCRNNPLIYTDPTGLVMEDAGNDEGQDSEGSSNGGDFPDTTGIDGPTPMTVNGSIEENLQISNGENKNSSKIKSLWLKYNDYYNDELNRLYGCDLKWADETGLWGAVSMAVNLGISGFQTLMDSLASEQVSNFRIKGSFERGNILSKIRAADVGAQTSNRIMTLRTGLKVTGTISAVVTAGATGYSAGARLNAAVRAIAKSL